MISQSTCPSFPVPARSAAPSSVSARSTRPAPRGTWRYQPGRRARRAFGLPAVAAIALHALVLFAYTSAPAPAPVAAPEELIEVRLALPAIPLEPEEQPVPELAEAAESAGPLPVPALEEIPRSVALDAFTQAADFRPQLNVEFKLAELVNIPLQFGPGNGTGGAGLGNVFNLADLDRAPEPLVQTPPLYPYDQRRLGISRAEVIVTFVVDPEGRVTNLRVESSSNPDFESSALAGVAKWKFRPGIKSGQKVATRMRVPLRFRLEDADV